MKPVLWLLAIWSISFCAYGDDLIGSASCATSTCHGGVIGRGPAWNNAFNLSRSRDPHATAGQILKNEISLQMIQRLDPLATTEEQQDLILRQRCISCHTTAKPADLAAVTPLEPALIGEGVSCESCHGPAKKWLTEHTRVSWNGAARFDSSTGMRDSESLISRAETCVRCHVGSRTDDGMIRDMNHDLIAAGHPALRFDLLTYNENMPQHWDLNGDVERSFNASALRVRRVGRAVGMSAAANLSAERAAAAQAKPDQVPWPELSDFDCFACHQNLLARSYRLQSTKDGALPLQVSGGLPLWNAWFCAQEEIDSIKQLYQFQPKPATANDWVKAAKEIAQKYREQALKLATEIVIPKDADQVGRIKNVLQRREPSGWSQAAILYLDLEAANRDLMQVKGYAEMAEQFLGDDKLLNQLQFGSPTPGVNASHSPEKFNPNAFWKLFNQNE